MQNEQIGWVDFVCEGLILDSQTTNEFWDVLEDWGENSINKPCNRLGTYPYPYGRIYVSESKKSFYDKETIPGRMACYSGEFKNGKRNGEGNLAKPKGKVEIRHWEKSKHW